MDWKNKIQPQVLDWLLEEDPVNPSIRYLALSRLLDLPPGNKDVQEALQAVMQTGPVPAILAEQDQQGFWAEPGPGYLPKYRSTVWQIIMLAQLGADGSDERIRKACVYLLENTRADHGGFSMTASGSGAIHCLQGNLCAALLQLGCQDDPRMWQAIHWMANSVTGDEFVNPVGETQPIKYYRSGLSGPGFLCSANDHQPCAWGAVKVALAFSRVPPQKRTPILQKAIRTCLDFLLSVDPLTAVYPHPYAPKPSTSWFKFGFPVFYVTDLLQNLTALVGLGLAGDARLQNAIDFLLSKKDDQGRWNMEYTYNGKTWVDIEEKKEPSKWVTLRALSVLKQYYTD